MRIYRWGSFDVLNVEEFETGIQTHILQLGIVNCVAIDLLLQKWWASLPLPAVVRFLVHQTWISQKELKSKLGLKSEILLRFWLLEEKRIQLKFDIFQEISARSCVCLSDQCPFYEAAFNIMSHDILKKTFTGNWSYFILVYLYCRNTTNAYIHLNSFAQVVI